MLNFNEVKKYFRLRFYTITALFLVGLLVFLVWVGLYFTDQNYRLIDRSHQFGFLYFIISMLSGCIIFLCTLATIIYKFKEFKKNAEFRSGFLKFTGIIFICFSIALGLSKVVIHFASRVSISVINKSEKNINEIRIIYPFQKIDTLRLLKPGETKTQRVTLSGEGAIEMEILYSDGSSHKDTIEGYVSPPSFSVPQINVEVLDADVLKITSRADNKAASP